MSHESLVNLIRPKSLEILGLQRKPMEKEGSYLRWTGKKRDAVDEILVQELQQEEKEWTNYDHDEVSVKKQVADAVLDELLAETYDLFQNILDRKYTQSIC